MESFPGSPRTLRGAIVAADVTSPLSRVVVFQYNPDAVTRKLVPRGAAAADTDVSPADAHRLWGAPVETITMKVEVDAADQLERNDPVAAVSGIAPQLAALEMLLYPSTVQVIENAGLVAVGTIEILPMEGPLTVLVWGPARVVPVRVESLAITEEAFDPALNPIRATVEVSVQVLSYNDLPASDAGNALFLVHQILKETLATTAGRRETVAAAAGGLATAERFAAAF